jgi:hypothetical protein
MLPQAAEDRAARTAIEGRLKPVIAAIGAKTRRKGSLTPGV